MTSTLITPEQVKNLDAFVQATLSAHAKGAWSSTTAYALNDWVTYLGTSYYALQAGTNHNPASSPTYWGVLAAKGDTGATGATGPTGPAGSGGSGGSGSASSGLLTVTQYNPGTTVTLTNNSATPADVDATNAAVTFVVPGSGKVLIRAAMTGVLDGGTGLGVNLRLGSTDVAGSNQRVLRMGGTNPHVRINYSYLLTGLTPGATVTYKLGFYRTDGSNNQLMIGGTDMGALVMEACSFG